MSQKKCIECKETTALYWDNNFCETCIREIFKENKTTGVDGNYAEFGKAVLYTKETR